MINPSELAALYDTAHDNITAAQSEGRTIPADILNQWPNALGTLRRVPGQPYYRAGPNGCENPLTEGEADALRFFFRTTCQRLVLPAPTYGYGDPGMKVGDRIELSPACDLWMQGARFGEIRKIDPNGTLSVKMDHWQVKRLVKVNSVNARKVKP